MTAGVLGRVSWRSLPANLLVALVAALVLAGISVPVMLSRSAPAQDMDAKELLLNAAVRMRACASLEGEGSFAGCDAEEMRDAETGIEWRDGLASFGLRGKPGTVYLSKLDDSAYRLETTSASGRIFTYVYEDGVVRRGVLGGPGGGW
jgi:hypothetical protein